MTASVPAQLAFASLAPEGIAAPKRLAEEKVSPVPFPFQEPRFHMNTTNEIDFLLEFTVFAKGWMARISVLRSQFLVAL